MEFVKNICGVFGCNEDISFACLGCPAYLCFDHFMTESTDGSNCHLTKDGMLMQGNWFLKRMCKIPLLHFLLIKVSLSESDYQM